MQWAIRTGLTIRLKEGLRRKQVAVGNIVPGYLVVRKKKTASGLDCSGVQSKSGELVRPEQFSALAEGKMFTVQCEWRETRKALVVGSAKRVMEVAIKRLGERPIAVGRHMIKGVPHVKEKADEVIVFKTPGNILDAGTGSGVGHASRGGGKMFGIEGLLRAVLEQVRHKPHAAAGDSASQQDVIVEVIGLGARERSVQRRIAGKALLQAAENFGRPGSRVDASAGGGDDTNGSLGSWVRIFNA